MYDMRGNTLSRLKWLNDNLLIVKKGKYQKSSYTRKDNH